MGDPDKPDLFDELPYVRGSDTSREAAELAEPNAGTQRAIVLAELRRYPPGLTDHQLQELLDMNPSDRASAPHRTGELRAGHVTPAMSGQRRPDAAP